MKLSRFTDTVTSETALRELYCAKSIKRSKLWDQTSWIEQTKLPSIGQMLLDHTHITDKTAQQLDAYLEEDYKQLY